jgi:WD40 repeat-containing protein SMU1
VVDKIVKYPEESKISAMAMSHGGEYLALGFDDGLIEIYNPNQYKIDSKLEYQSNNNFIFHTSTVTCLAFQETDEMIATGDKSGQLKVWNLLTGKCLRKINTGSHPVSALSFGVDPSHILSAYETIDVYGLKSSNILRTFKGHSAYVNSIIVI